MPRSPGFLHRSGFSLPALIFLLGTPHFAAAKCQRLERVDVERTAVLSQTRAQALVSPFLDKCLDSKLTQEMLAAISNHLIASGYVTTRPYLLEQDVSDGQIEVRILPGRIEAVVDADSGQFSSRIKRAFLFTGEILNLRELETSLEMIERVTSANASIEIRPGSKQGASIVAVSVEESDPFRLELGINAQSELDNQLSLLLNWDNPLDFNDILQFRLNDGEVRESFQSNHSRELNYSFPLGSFLLSLSRNEIEFEQRVQGSIGSFVSEGESVAERYRVSRILVRSQRHRVTLAVGLELADTENFFEGEPVDVSSYATSKLQLELLHDWYQPWGQLAARYTYHRGLDSFGARDDDYFSRTGGAESDARLQFEKFTFDGRLLYYLDGPDVYLDMGLNLQYSDDLLFDADKLNLGSPYTVRGYASALSGSNAWYLHGDLTFQLRSMLDANDDAAVAKSILLSLGLDYGEVKCELDNPDACGEIYAAALGLVIWDRNFSARLSWGHPLKQIGDDIGNEDIYLLDLRWSI